MQRRLFVSLAATLSLLAVHAGAAAAPTLSLEVFNPGEKSVFPVSASIVSGPTEAVLIDAQFQRDDAEALVQKVRAIGKRLTTVYISHSDPDFYFGLDVVQAAFPDARIVATASTVAAIRASMDGKRAYWGPVLKDNAPKKLVLPEVLAADHLTVDGQTLKIGGLQGAASPRSYLWIPSLKAVVGGVVVNSGSHVWVADTQTPASRGDWQRTLKGIAALRPATVVPGHFVDTMPKGLGAVTFTARYLEVFEAQAAKARDSAELVAAMKKAYPRFTDTSGLELGAKVIKGEMTWPQ